MSVTNFLTVPNAHETNIMRHFDGRVCFGGHSRVFDQPLAVLLFTNRCGSNLFADYLRGTGRICGLDEVINFPHVISASQRRGNDSFPEFLAAEARAAAPQGQVFGLKASAGQLAMLLRWNIPAMFNGIAIYRVVRHDIVDQAVSMAIAEQTGKWTSNIAGKPDAGEPDYAFEEVLKWVNRFTLDTAAGAILGTMLDAAMQTVVYEEFQHDPLPFVKKAVEHLGQDASQIIVTEPSIRKQANELNKEFRRRFLDDVRQQIHAGLVLEHGQ